MLDLVTGATRFIGSHLAQRLLRERRHVRVLCSEGSEHELPPDVAASAEIARGDLRDRASLEAAMRGATRVFHCASDGLDWGPERELAELDVRGTQWLFEAASCEADVLRVVHFSSIAVFGTPLPAHFDDESPHGTTPDAYSRTKVLAENIALAFGADGLPVTILRPAVVYGARGRWLEEPLAMIEKGRFFLVGGGEGTCHPCYIENLLDAALIAADDPHAVGGAYIVGDEQPMTFKAYFDGIAAIAGKPPVRRSVPLVAARALAGVLELGARAVASRSRPLLTRTTIDMLTTESTMSMGAIRRELGFRPRYDFASAVDELRAARAAAAAAAGEEPASFTRARSGPTPSPT